MYLLAFKLAMGHVRTNLFSRIAVIVSMAVILLCGAMVFILYQGVSRSLAEVRSARFMTAYLDGAVPVTREADVLSAVRKMPGVESAQMVSKDVFVENFSKLFPKLSGEVAALEADTIPRFVKVRARTSRMTDVQERLQRLSGIENVELNENKFVGLMGALHTLKKLSAMLIGGMLFALLCVLFNHFKLRSSLQAQVFGTLTLLGAKGHQLYLPFAMEGIVEGAVGGGIAAAVLLIYGGLIQGQLSMFFGAIGAGSFSISLLPAAMAMMVTGVCSGAVGSVWAAMRAKSRA